MNRTALHLSIALVTALCLAPLAPAPAEAADTWTSPHPGIRMLERTTGRPWRIRALIVDLCADGVSIQATGPNQRQQTVPSYAQAIGAEAAVNGDFFRFEDYSTLGVSIGNGNRWGDTADNNIHGFLAFGTGRAWFSPPIDVVSSPPGWIESAVSGHPAIVRDGAPRTFTDSLCTDRHPRTAAGVTRDGQTLILAVVDGRSSSSIGMNCTELANLMIELGAWDALNLDGGGSSTMWVRGQGVVNNPSDGTARTVANHLAVHATGSGQPGSCDPTFELWRQHGRFIDDPRLHHSDLDGDGRADACIRTVDDAGLQCHLADDTGFAASPRPGPTPMGAGWNAPEHFGTIAMADLDGDGDADLCGRHNTGIRCWRSEDAQWGPMIQGPPLSDEAGYDQVEHYSSIALADVDGDGGADLCARRPQGLRCWRLRDDDTFGDAIDGPSLDSNHWNQPEHLGTLRFADVTGEGRADVCGRAEDVFRCWRSRADGSFGNPFDGPAWTDDKGWDHPAHWSTIRLHDVDADGRADLCARTPNNGFTCHLAQAGGSFGAAIEGPPMPDGEWADPSNYETIRLADLDGDGDADLCARANDGVRCWFFRNGGFRGRVDTGLLADDLGWWRPEHYRTVRLADVDGDGRADLCARRNAGLRCWMGDGTGQFANAVNGPDWSDAAGYDHPRHYATLLLGGITCTPSAPELCNGRDDNCNGQIDEGCTADDPDPGPSDIADPVPDAATDTTSPPPDATAADTDIIGPPDATADTATDTTTAADTAAADTDLPTEDILPAADDCACQVRASSDRTPGPLAWLLAAAVLLVAGPCRRLRRRPPSGDFLSAWRPTSFPGTLLPRIDSPWRGWGWRPRDTTQPLPEQRRPPPLPKGGDVGEADRGGRGRRQRRRKGGQGWPEGDDLDGLPPHVADRVHPHDSPATRH